MRVVLDTNIIVSASLFGGKPKQILKYSLNDALITVTSQELLQELARTLYRLSQKYDSELNITAILHNIAAHFELVAPTSKLHILADEPDNRVLEAAVAGQCDLIITGDKRFLELQEFQGIRIVTANQFLEQISPLDTL